MWRQFACAGRIGVSPDTAVDLELCDRIDGASELKLKRGLSQTLLRMASFAVTKPKQAVGRQGACRWHVKDLTLCAVQGLSPSGTA